MGLCQGGTCGRLVKRILAEELNIPASQIEENTDRAPARPMEVEKFERRQG